MGKRMSVAMQQGVGIEGAARLSYSQFKGATVNPACVQSNTCGWLRASIDGLSADGTVAVEIKGGQHTYREVQRSRQVPAHYYAQLQHILLVTGLHSIDFWCYLDRRQPLFMVVERDCAYISRLFAAEKAFWEELQDEATSLAVPSITAKSIVVSSLQIPLPQKPS